MQEFKKAMEETATNGKKLLVDFYADWCGPCKKIGPKFEVLFLFYKNNKHQEYSKQYENVEFCKINVDDSQVVDFWNYFICIGSCC